MRNFPRLVAVVAGLAMALIILPPTFAMDVMERIVSTQTGMIRREASEYQKKVAEANARAYMAARLRAYRHSKPEKNAGPAPTPKSHKKEVVENEQAPTADEKRALRKKLPRYIAVDTPKDKRSAPGTKKDVMIWDTQSETFAGTYVYDVPNPPSVGSTAKFDTYSAEYVANGL
ncbi:MAG TPA: hypothetical protein VGM54_07865 [Chthoniobacter sp.]|jgi:hypothetical protein